MTETLASRLSVDEEITSDVVLDRFLGWVTDRDLKPYPAQEEAWLQLFAGHHVILATPTGSGKTLVALGLLFKALAEGKRAFYTCPIKALVSEKFFAFCEEFGAERVGMLTGDARINSDAPIICCTAEVLSNMSLRGGEEVDAPYVVMDEFHYYGDRARGMAWQAPLLTMPSTQFLMMSATLGDTTEISKRIEARTRRRVETIYSEDRPVPLDFEYSEVSLPETVESLLDQSKAPLYIVHFTQRECAEQAQGLTSAKICNRGERQAIAEAIGDFRFSSPYGRDVRRIVQSGVGIHHAGLLPRYRLLIEQLAQQGLLKVICGTDTLGVGVNIPIRSVLFSKLVKFDGEKVGVLSVREFKQIAGRAGRKGFDELGSVVVQAPARIIAREKRQKKKNTGKGQRKPRVPRRQMPWNLDTFQRLVYQPPEPLESRFSMNHGVLLNLLQRPADNRYRTVLDLIADSHETTRSKRRLVREAAQLFRSLHRAGIIGIRSRPSGVGRKIEMKEDLQYEFSLNQSLSLYLVDAVTALDPSDLDYAYDVLTLVEAILSNPMAVLVQQKEKRKSQLMTKLKGEGVAYEERLRRLDRVSYDKPNAEFIYETFSIFCDEHPWVDRQDIHPKSIARELYEQGFGFDGYVRHYRLMRSEGVLLRYLSEVYNTLAHSVPQNARTEAVYDMMASFRALISRVDSSLVETWETMVEPAETDVVAQQKADHAADLARHPKAFAARVRAEMHELVRALSNEDFDEATRSVKQSRDNYWDAARFADEMKPFFDEYEALIFDPRARTADRTLIEATGARTWDVQQILLDPEGDHRWAIYATVELAPGPAPDDPILNLVRIGL